MRATNGVPNNYYTKNDFTNLIKLYINYIGFDTEQTENKKSSEKQKTSFKKKKEKKKRR